MTLRSIDEIKQLATKAAVVPIYKELLGDLETPISALLKVQEGAKGVFLLESVEGGEKIARYSFLGRDPLSRFRAHGKKIEITGFGAKSFDGEPLAELRNFFAPFKGVADSSLPPFTGGAVGYIAYDAIRYIEKIPSTGRDDLHIPDIDMGIYDHFMVFDQVRHRVLLVANVIPFLFKSVDEAYTDALSKIGKLEKYLKQPIPQIPPTQHIHQLKSTISNAQTAEKQTSSQHLPQPQLFPLDGFDDWFVNQTPQTYLDGVGKCKEYILAGDAFQIVLSQRFETNLKVSPLQVYRSLRSINPSPYMYYLRFDDFEVVGASPELLVRVNNGKVETRPIAGSRPRGKDEAEDIALGKELIADEKERAEHVMLVDLGRNDLGRVSTYGTVRVSELMSIERYSHIMHIVSNVQGDLRPDVYCLDALMSCFPAGTLSGAPKIRAMEIIDGLEPTRRGVYGGAICYMDFQGNLDSCIAIRTMVVKDGKAYVQAGAGLVADSDPKREYEETLSKAKATIRAIQLAEKIS